MEPIKELLPFVASNLVESVCRVEILPLNDGRRLVIVEELDENPGQSVSNDWETVVAKIAGKYDVDPRASVWIEHNANPRPIGGKTIGRWQLVTFKMPKSGEHEGKVEWRDMTPDDWRELGLSPRV